MVTIELEMVTYEVLTKKKNPILKFVLRSTPNHTPLKYVYPCRTDCPK